MHEIVVELLGYDAVFYILGIMCLISIYLNCFVQYTQQVFMKFDREDTSLHHDTIAQAFNKMI